MSNHDYTQLSNLSKIVQKHNSIANVLTEQSDDEKHVSFKDEVNVVTKTKLRTDETPAIVDTLEKETIQAKKII